VFNYLKPGKKAQRDLPHEDAREREERGEESAGRVRWRSGVVRRETSRWTEKKKKGKKESDTIFQKQEKKRSRRTDVVQQKKRPARTARNVLMGVPREWKKKGGAAGIILPRLRPEEQEGGKERKGRGAGRGCDDVRLNVGRQRKRSQAEAEGRGGKKKKEKGGEKKDPSLLGQSIVPGKSALL